MHWPRGAACGDAQPRGGFNNIESCPYWAGRCNYYDSAFWRNSMHPSKEPDESLFSMILQCIFTHIPYYHLLLFLDQICRPRPRARCRTLQQLWPSPLLGGQCQARYFIIIIILYPYNTSYSRLAADWYCVRFGAKHVSYAGLESGERNVASHVIKLNNVWDTSDMNAMRACSICWRWVILLLWILTSILLSFWLPILSHWIEYVPV